ncbi:MAG: PKD domain-containing protein [Bacteroidota bacterium]
MNKRTIFSTVLVSLCCYTGLSQSTPATRTLDMMNNERGSYTGSANININLYNIQVDGITIPVNLTYNSSGIKVQQEASWVGLGWDLSIGGSITESTFGNAFDENEFDRRDEPIFDFEGLGVAGTYGTNTTNVPFVGCEDEDLEGPNGEEANIFNYNALGYSGKFYWDYRIRGFKFLGQKNGNVVISGVRSQDNFGDWVSFTIKPGNGLRLIFERDVRISEIADVWEPDQGYPSGKFHLSKVILSNGKTIDFRYVGPYAISSWSYNRVISGNSQESKTEGGDHYPDTYADFLSKITTPYETIDFSFSSRSDLHRVDNPKVRSLFPRLSQITIREKVSNQVIKRIKFDNNHYFQSDDGSRRLQLRSISVPDNQFENYVFQYNATKLPPKNSFAVDHWGYYNGEHGNTSFFPRYSSGTERGDASVIGHIPDSNFPEDLTNWHLTGIATANRGANEHYMQAGMLKTIIYGYPGYGNGWVKRFEYEAHRFIGGAIRSANYLNGSQEYQGYSIGGGLRIKSIRYDFNEATAIPFRQTDFVYEYDDGSTSGLIMNRINYVRQRKAYDPQPRDIYEMHSSPVLAMPFTPTVAYKRVKTINRSFAYDNVSTGEYYALDETDGEVISEYHCEQPAIVHRANHPQYDALKDWLPSFDLPLNGRMKKTTVKARDGSLVSEKTYEYEIADFETYNSVATERVTWYEDCDTDLPGIGTVHYRIGYYPLDTWRVLPIRETTTIYDDVNEPFTTSVTRAYADQGLLRTTTTEESDGSELTTVYRYALDPDATFTNPPLSAASSDVKYYLNETESYQGRNVMEVLSYRDGVLLERNRTDYARQYLIDREPPITSTNYFYPKTISTATGNAPLRKNYEVSVIDDHTGMVLESGSGRASAAVSTRLFSYNNSRLVATIPNGSFQEVTSALGVPYETFKYYTDDAQITAALNNLRSALQNELPITTQLYDLRYGVKEVTSANGEKQVIEFDQYGDPRIIRDEDGNIIQRNRTNLGGEKSIETDFSIEGTPERGTPIEFKWLGTSREFVDDLRFFWDFGDGTRITGGPTIQHTYQTSGYFEPSLEIYTGAFSGTRTVKNISIDILNVRLCISDGPYLIDAVTDEIVARGNCAPENTTSVNPTFTATTQEGCPPFTYKWYYLKHGESEWTQDTSVPASSSTYTFILPDFPTTWDGQPLTSPMLLT